MSIEVSIQGLAKVEAAFKNNPKRVSTVLSRAVNRTTVNVRANMAKKVRENYVMKAADVKNSVEILKATTQKPYATVKSVGKKISLTKFKISPDTPRPQKPPKKGYRVQIKKSEGLKTVPRGFLVESKGGLGFFQRVSTARLPIKRLMGPSIPEMINHKDTIKYIESEAKQMLDKRLESELEWALGARKK